MVLAVGGGERALFGSGEVRAVGRERVAGGVGRAYEGACPGSKLPLPCWRSFLPAWASWIE